MKNLMGLGLAALLGLAAAGLNWVWISGLATPEQYVALKSDVRSGDEVTEDDLQAIPVPGDSERLRESLIPWRNRAILFGFVAKRDYQAGDIVFQRDILPPIEHSRWDVIGPFKLISVGERFKERTGEEPSEARTDGNNLTIAVDANFDERTRKLLEVIKPDPDGARRKPAIVAVQVLPANQRESDFQRIESQEIVYQTISLDGIANVPQVLLAGEMIRFVVPIRPRY